MLFLSYYQFVYYLFIYFYLVLFVWLDSVNLLNVYDRTIIHGHIHTQCVYLAVKENRQLNVLRFLALVIDVVHATASQTFLRFL